MRLHVSYSELGQFENTCQWKWKLDYLDNQRSESFSIHFDFGTAVHHALERFVTRKDPLSVDDAVKTFQEKLTHLESTHKEKYGDSKYKLSELLSSGEHIIRNIKDCEELLNIDVMYNEFPLLEQIGREDGQEIKFKGFIDLVIKAKDKRGNSILYVCDFKTCSWGWSREDREDRWKHYQILLYKHFLCKKLDLDPKAVRVAFILCKKRPPKGKSAIEFFPVSAGPVSVQRALDTMGRIITEMSEKSKTGNFEKNRSSCKNKYGSTCPYLGTTLCTE